MATLVSPGVSVTVTDESFFIPAAATTVPLIFVATRSGKTQPDGIQTAVGTTEANVVRTVTSLGQSLQLYGVPYFHQSTSGAQFHGDARNEYGLFALNQYLGIGNRAFVVRANIDTTDEPISYPSLGTPAEVARSYNGIGDGVLSSISVNGPEVRPEIISIEITGFGTGGAVFSVSGTVSGHIGTGVVGTLFNSTVVDFTITDGVTPFVPGDKFTVELGYVAEASPFAPGAQTVTGVGDGSVVNIAEGPSAVVATYTIDFTSPTSYTVTSSVNGVIGTGTVSVAFSSPEISFTVVPGVTPFAALDQITFSMAASSNVGDGTVVDLLPGALAETLTIDEVVTIKFTSPTAYEVFGPVTGVSAGVINSPHDHNSYATFTVVPGATPFAADDEFNFTISQINIASPLGTNDAQRRLAIVTALQAAINSNTEVRSPLYEFNLILCPGYPEVVDELVALSTDVKEEALVLADTPANQTPEQVAQWALTSARQQNNKAAYYYPWGLASNLDGTDVMCAPSGIALRTIAYSDSVAYVWTAPAGAARGVVTGISRVGYYTGTAGTATTFIEANLNEGQRDNLYDYNKNINPITFFPGRGLLIWGQKTSAPVASALDRINVMRLVMYLRRALRKGALPFVFEPNDKITRDNLKTAADGIMNDILIKRGLVDYASYCDETNNTPDRVDRNELYLDVAIKPTKAAEFIYIPIRVVAQSAEI